MTQLETRHVYSKDCLIIQWPQMKKKNAFLSKLQQSVHLHFIPLDPYQQHFPCFCLVMHRQVTRHILFTLRTAFSQFRCKEKKKKIFSLNVQNRFICITLYSSTTLSSTFPLVLPCHASNQRLYRGSLCWWVVLTASSQAGTG